MEGEAQVQLLGKVGVQGVVPSEELQGRGP